FGYPGQQHELSRVISAQYRASLATGRLDTTHPEIAAASLLPGGGSTLAQLARMVIGLGSSTDSQAGEMPNLRTKPAEPKHGENIYTRAGRKAHIEEPLPPGFQRSVRLPSGKEMDGYNPDTREVIEIKPNNSRAIRRGEKQVQEYCAEGDQAYGSGHTARGQTYHPQQYLEDLRLATPAN